MFKKTSKESQLNMFSAPSALLSGKSLKMYDDETGWHNKFRQHVTNNIDEEVFRPLYSSDNGSPNAPIRVLVAMMILKEGEGISDQKLFENCRFNMLTRSAIGLMNADDTLPTESTYYLFRKRVVDYERVSGENLFQVIFQQVTKKQCVDFEVSGKAIRMDSKLLGSNIAWLSRYELIHETFRSFYREVKLSGKLDESTIETLDSLLKVEGTKVTYRSSNDEVQTRLRQLGVLIYRVLPLFTSADAPDFYQTLERVFNEQFKVSENKTVIPREKEGISPKSVQSPHDPDCTYKNKGETKVKGYSINVTESCDKGNVLNLIGHVDVRQASTPDVDFLQDGIMKVEETFCSNVEAAHADGAYHNEANLAFCKSNGRNIELYLHAIQGFVGRFKLDVVDGKVLVFDTLNNLPVDAHEIVDQKGEIKWRILLENKYRYFTQKELNTSLTRKRIAETPVEVLQRRNNVEATIFQLGYHYSNAKSRYRGLTKHQMWANTRCLWVNFVRLFNFTEKLRLARSFFTKNRLAKAFIEQLHAFQFLIWLNFYEAKHRVQEKSTFCSF